VVEGQVPQLLQGQGVIFLIYTAGLMFLIRTFGSGVSQKSPLGTLIVCSVLTFLDLQDHVGAGLIYNFDFSYRGGTEYDKAFTLGNKTDAFMIVGKPAELEFVKLNQAVDLDATEEQEVSAEEISFENLT